MALSIVNNLAAYNAQRQYKINVGRLTKSQEKLSSGYRINRAADDAAGLSISEQMRRQIRGLDRGAMNIQDGISVIQVADGALSEVTTMVNRMTELSVQAANGTNSMEDRMAIQNEIDELVAEINRVGETTDFNSIPLFQNPSTEEHDERLTSLLNSPGGKDGYLTEAYSFGGKYYPSGSVDFSKITAGNIKYLEGQGFGFTCSQSCSEAFNFTFTLTGASSASNLGSSQAHQYVINIADCTTGEQIVNKLYDYVSANQPASAGGDTNKAPGALTVSHSNYMVKEGSKIIVYANNTQYSTPEAAKTAFNNNRNSNSPYGKITCSDITYEAIEATLREIPIQCSSNTDDVETIQSKEMNATTLGLNGISVLTDGAAKNAIDRTKTALERVTQLRSEFGAMQNRLEHAYDSNKNNAENLQAAESRIRDTDIPKEMMRYSAANIVRTAGETMISQANQQHAGIVSLLQQ